MVLPDSVSERLLNVLVISSHRSALWVGLETLSTPNCDQKILNFDVNNTILFDFNNFALQLCEFIYPIASLAYFLRLPELNLRVNLNFTPGPQG
jgi:hypothetical protein